MRKKRIFTTLYLFLVWLALPNQIFSQVGDDQVLVGIGTLNVLVEKLDPVLEQGGLTKEKIKTDVEIKLRLAKFKVESSDKYLTPVAMLYINVGSVESECGEIAISINTSLEQFVNLGRNKSVSFLTATWRTKTTATVTKQNVRKIREIISDQLDIFINDYLKANASTQSNNLPDLSKYAIKNPPPTPPTKQDESPFTSVYVGGNGPPEVEVFNDSDITLYLNLGQGVMTPYTIPSKTRRKLTLTEGDYGFKATAPGVSPLEGQKLFEKGHIYYWKFVVISTGYTIRGGSPRRKRRRP